MQTMAHPAFKRFKAFAVCLAALFLAACAEMKVPSLSDLSFPSSKSETKPAEAKTPATDAEVAAAAGVAGVAGPSFDPAAPRSCISKASAKGRFSIKYQVGDAEEQLTGGFEWVQTDDTTVLTLSSPLGQAMAKIKSTPKLTTFYAPNRAPKSAKNAEALITSELGWSIPMNDFKYWLQGCGVDLNGNAFTATPLSRDIVTHSGWLISYNTWIEGPPMTLPKRINLMKGTRDLKGIEVELKLVIDEWSF